MSELFISVLNMSLTASYVILFVILCRLLLKRCPKIISYVLWSVVAFRLIIPFSFESMYSLLPQKINTSPISHDIMYQQSPQFNSGIGIVDSIISNSLPAPSIGDSVNPLQIYLEIGAFIWIIGAVVLLIYSLVSIITLKKQLKSAQPIEKNTYEAKDLKTPFVLGIIIPKIYLPTGLSTQEKSYILLHEQTHINRKDHIVKVFAFLILCIHWFNPLVWIAFMLMSMDMEVSCDERVIKEAGNDTKKPYATTLLSLSSGRHILNGSPLAFGEGSIKGRIKNILDYKRPKFWVVTTVIIAVIAVSIGLVANPRSTTPSMLWAKSLQLNDVESIELIVQPSDEQEQYKKFEAEEITAIIKLINSSNGTLVQYPESISGRTQTIFITLKNGEVHHFINSGNTYLIIDGDTYMAKRDWLNSWNYEGNSDVPTDFWERAGIKATSYQLIWLKKGEVQRTIAPLNKDDSKLAQEIIMNYMIRSSAWPGVDINSLENCYLVRTIYSDGTTSENYAYLHEGKTVMQHGKDGHYTIVDTGLYERLVQLIN